MIKTQAREWMREVFQRRNCQGREEDVRKGRFLGEQNEWGFLRWSGGSWKFKQTEFWFRNTWARGTKFEVMCMWLYVHEQGSQLQETRLEGSGRETKIDWMSICTRHWHFHIYSLKQHAASFSLHSYYLTRHPVPVDLELCTDILLFSQAHLPREPLYLPGTLFFAFQNYARTYSSQREAPH